MKRLLNTSWLALIALALVASPALAGHHKHDKKDKKAGGYAKANLVETARAAGSFNTLLTAAKEAGLAETLATGGPFTVFAPTDAAFAKLPEGTLEALLNDPQALKQVLLLHVVPGKVKAEEVVSQSSLDSLYGQPIYVDTASAPTIDGASIIKTDVMASNGVIHVIDQVILPKDIVGIAAADERFSTLVAAVKTAGLVETLQSEGPFTVLAPTNDAFAKLPEGTVESLLKPAGREKLQSILTYHVASGRVMSGQVVEMDAIPTLQGETIDVSVKQYGGKTSVMLNDAKVLITDIKASNGVIHVIDSVLMPE